MMARVRGLVLGLLLSFALPLGAALAEEEPADRAASFKAVTGSGKEDVPGGALMVSAYALIWVALLVYVYRLVRLHKNVDENLARLQQDLSKAAGRLEAPK